MAMSSRGGIKSVQRGVISLAGATGSATATITSVNTAKAYLMLEGFTTATTAALDHSKQLRGELTNATTVTVTRGFSAPEALSIPWQVVEFI